MKLLLVKLATLTLVLELQTTSAQLFPWSNLKQYFDQKTRYGPGSGGVLNIQQHDLEDVGVHHVSTSAERPYRHTDSKTSILSNNPLQDSTEILKDVTKHILTYSKNNFDNYENEDEETEYKNKPLAPVLTVNHDSTVKPFPIKKKTNTGPTLKNGENGNDEAHGMVVITQKPIMLDDKERSPHNNRHESRHKTVSILPESSSTINTKMPALVQFGQSVEEDIHQPILYVTANPVTTQLYPVTMNHNQFTDTHEILQPLVINPYRTKPQYHGMANTKPTTIFLPTVPPLTTLPINVFKNRPQTSNPEVSNMFYNGNKQFPLHNNVDQVSSTYLPKLQSSTKKPFIINTGLLDYLVPPPLPSSTAQQTYGSKQRNRIRRPHNPIKEPVASAENPAGRTTYKNPDTFSDYKVINEMSKLKPPENKHSNIVENSKNKHGTSGRNNKKIKNSLNVIKEQTDQKKRTQRQQSGSKKLHKIPVKHSGAYQKRNKYSNHNGRASPSYAYKKDSGVRSHPDSSSTHVNEQIMSDSGHSGNDGERVEFQMHGENGPKSYKFGFDTGKNSHNRQFRYEERDTHGHVKGHYGYYDKEGKLQVVNYEADPKHGFKAERAI